jgi:hypothetical protein
MITKKKRMIYLFFESICGEMGSVNLIHVDFSVFTCGSDVKYRRVRLPDKQR